MDDSRLTTVVGCIKRLNAEGALETAESLSLYFVGADFNEIGLRACDSMAFTTPLLSQIAGEFQLKSLFVYFVGPNLPLSIETSNFSLEIGGMDANVKFYCGLLHEILAIGFPVSRSLFVLFNAGIWGYDSWNETMEMIIHFCKRNASYCLVTAYTLMEAEDDFDKIQAMVETQQESERLVWLWECEQNPFRSQIDCDRRCGPNGVPYRENCYWSCFH